MPARRHRQWNWGLVSVLLFGGKQQNVVKAVAGRWILPQVFDTVNKFMHLLKGDCEKKQKQHVLRQGAGLI